MRNNLVINYTLLSFRLKSSSLKQSWILNLVCPGLSRLSCFKLDAPTKYLENTQMSRFSTSTTKFSWFSVTIINGAYVCQSVKVSRLVTGQPHRLWQCQCVYVHTCVHAWTCGPLKGRGLGLWKQGQPSLSTFLTCCVCKAECSTMNPSRTDYPDWACIVLRLSNLSRLALSMMAGCSVSPAACSFKFLSLLRSLLLVSYAVLLHMK